MDFLKNLSGSTVSRSAELLADDGYVVHDHDAAGGGTVLVAFFAGCEDYGQLVGLGGIVFLGVFEVERELGEIFHSGGLEAAGGADLIRCVDVRTVEGLVLAGDLVEYHRTSLPECISAIR